MGQDVFAQVKHEVGVRHPDQRHQRAAGVQQFAHFGRDRPHFAVYRRFHLQIVALRLDLQQVLFRRPQRRRVLLPQLDAVAVDTFVQVGLGRLHLLEGGIARPARSVQLGLRDITLAGHAQVAVVVVLRVAVLRLGLRQVG